MKLKGAEILIECLLEQGVDTIYGYPGGTVLDIYDALYRNGKINHILTAHEQGAAHAADGYARATGKVGVCFATSGPGATNLVTGIATAFMDSIPLVAITGNVGINMLGRDSFQEVDIAGITIPITKHNYIVKDVTQLAETVRRAFYIANSGRKGPVLIDILKNVQVAECEFEPASPYPAKSPAIDEEKVKATAEIINEAKKPIIIAGGGVISSGASPYLKELAQKLNAPVTYTLIGKGAIADSDPLCIGMIGMHGTFTSAKALIASDVIIALGTRFSDRVALNRDMFANGKKVIHIDIDNAEFNKNVKCTIPVLAEVDSYLKAVLPLVNPHDRKWMDEVDAYERGGEVKANTSIMAYKILKKAGQIAPAGNPIIADVGQNQMWAAQYFSAVRPRQFITSGGLGTMGYSMGAAIGASMGTGKLCTVVVGDGSFNMNMNELSTAVTYGVPLVILLMNNSVLGMVRQWQKIFYGRRFSQTTLNKKTDYVKFAESFGAKGLRISDESEIESVLNEAYSYAEKNCAPVLVDCKISCDENVLPMIKPGQTYDTQLNKMED